MTSPCRDNLFTDYNVQSGQRTQKVLYINYKLIAHHCYILKQIDDCSIPVAAGVSAAVVVIVSVVSSLISICITYLIMRKKGQQNGGQPSNQDKVYYESVNDTDITMKSNPCYGLNNQNIKAANYSEEKDGPYYI